MSGGGIGGRVATGAFWMVLGRWGVRLIGIVSTVILARLLTPADYGLVGLATLLHFLVQSASDFSLDVDLIRTQTAERSRYDTVWTLEVMRGAANAALVMAIAVPMSAILAEPRLHGIALCIAAIAMADGFANVGIVEFRRDLQFARQFVLTLLSKLLSFAVAVPLAFVLRSYWALLLGMLAAAVARLALSYALHAYRPRFSLACWRQVLDFSKWLWFSSQLFFLRSRSDELFVSKWAGLDALGYYKIAREVAQMPTSELITPILQAIFPGFSRLNSQGAGLRDVYLLVVGGTVVLMAPLSIGLVATADLVLRLGFGVRWLPATPLLQLLAVAGLVEMFALHAYTVFVTLGHPRYSTYASMVGAASFVVLLVVLVPPLGSVGAALALIASTLLGSIVNLHLAHRLLELRWSALAAPVARPLAAALAAASVVTAFRHLWPAPASAGAAALLLLCCVVLGLAVYAGVLLALWVQGGRPRSAEATIIDYLDRALRRHVPALARVMGPALAGGKRPAP